MKKKKVLKINNDVEKLKVYYPEAFDNRTGWFKYPQSYGYWYGFYERNILKYVITDDGFQNITSKCLYAGERKATHEEIATALINEAEKRGYKKGVNCKFGLSQDIRTITSDVFNYSKEDGSLSLGHNVIFINGKWAEIIPTKQMTKEEIEKELGYKIEII